jgi:hypothetical protein
VRSFVDVEPVDPGEPVLCSRLCVLTGPEPRASVTAPVSRLGLGTPDQRVAHAATAVREVPYAPTPQRDGSTVTPRPNIIMVLADDHAAHAMSCYDSLLNSTPNRDRIAAEGMRFDNCFCTNSICTPSRATILTGTYSHVNGVTTPGDALRRATGDLRGAAGRRGVPDRGHDTLRPGRREASTSTHRPR